MLGFRMDRNLPFVQGGVGAIVAVDSVLEQEGWEPMGRFPVYEIVVLRLRVVAALVALEDDSGLGHG